MLTAVSVPVPTPRSIVPACSSSKPGLRGKERRAHPRADRRPADIVELHSRGSPIVGAGIIASLQTVPAERQLHLPMDDDYIAPSMRLGDRG